MSGVLEKKQGMDPDEPVSIVGAAPRRR